jgi:26S proteasome regulatory subunit N3
MSGVTWPYPLVLITMQDIAAKLHLASADDAEYIVAKAIRDGGIDAVIDHEGGSMSSKEVRNDK